MEHLKFEVNAEAKSVIQVELDKRANVRVMDYNNYCSYRNGGRHNFYGGEAKVSPVNIPVPHAGKWYVAIDLGGNAGRVSATVRCV